MSAIETETCPHCRGAGSWWGAVSTDSCGIVICEPCEASGLVVTCLECGDAMPEPEAFRSGQFCEVCRKELDAPEVAA